MDDAEGAPDARARERAAAGFSRAVEAYERARPGYPEAAIDWLAEAMPLRAGCRVADLGAGTGKLTRALAARAAALLAAVEPLEAMRRPLAALDGVLPVGGRAEELPFKDGSLDAVLSAQAFHWFDAGRAAAEAARVLRPGGALALLWNVRDESAGWVEALGRILEPLKAGFPRHDSGDWRIPFEPGGPFGPLEERVFPHRVEQSPEGVVDRVASLSYVASLPDGPREEVLGRVRDLLRTHPDTRGRGTVVFPYRTEAYLCRRRG